MQAAVIKAYQEERERSKQPGYVSRYDEYDAGDYEESYSTLVGEVNGPRTEGYRTHASHSTRGAHSSAHGNSHGGGHAHGTGQHPVAVRDNEAHAFGDGIL